MEFGMVIIGVVLIVGIGYLMTVTKSVKTKWIVWGLLIAFIIGPFTSWIIGILVGIYVGNGFAGGAVMALLIGIAFVAGLSGVVIGLFKKSPVN
ncbi:MAG: hypothetical protein ABS882_12255 [Lysinibacillus sp.]